MIRNGSDSVDSFLPSAGQMGTGGSDFCHLSGMLFSAGNFGGQADGEPGGADTFGDPYIHLCWSAALWPLGIFAGTFGDSPCEGIYSRRVVKDREGMIYFC